MTSQHDILASLFDQDYYTAREQMGQRAYQQFLMDRAIERSQREAKWTERRRRRQGRRDWVQRHYAALVALALAVLWLLGIGGLDWVLGL